MDEERRLEAGGEAASVTLRALSCGATYSVRAVAHSRAGPSPSSAPLLIKTKPPGNIELWSYPIDDIIIGHSAIDYNTVERVF